MKINATGYLSIAASLLFFLSGCSSSLVISPGVNLPVETLKKSQLDVQASAELFPETRPDFIDGSTSPGGMLLIGYGISNKTAIYAKGWLDFSTKGAFGTRSGFSLNMVNQLKQFSPSTKLLLLPKIGMVMDGKYRGGYGLELPVMLHYSYRQKVAFYGGFGFMYGLYDFNKELVDGEQKLRSGYAVTNHIGSSVYLFKALRLNIELTTLLQRNQFDDINNLIFSPSVGLGYTF